MQNYIQVLNYTIKFLSCQFYKSITLILLYALVFCLFFPIRNVILTPEAFMTGQYSDFTSFSLYISDILIILLAILSFLPRGIIFFQQYNNSLKEKLKGLFSNSYFPFLILWLILGFFLHFSASTQYWSLRLILLLVAYETIRCIVYQTEQTWIKLNILTNFFLYLSTFQALLALSQFYYQRPLGLFIAGEQLLSRYTVGFAKIIVSGETLVRGYGTFTHPNVLGAFFGVSILVTTWKLIISRANGYFYLYSLILFVNILGIFATFSRSAFFTCIFGLVLFYILLLVGKYRFNYLKSSILVVLLAFLAGFTLFKPFVLSRANLADQAIMERINYNKIGIEMLKRNLLFGLGAGSSVLHMQQYSNKPLEPWQKQPIHNYFLLSAVELGIPGVVLLVLIFLKHLKYIFINLTNSKGLLTVYPLLITILVSFLLLMQFDHYFYTLNQAQLLLWTTLGIIAGLKNSPKGEIEKQ